jgi:hypothetical protein
MVIKTVSHSQSREYVNEFGLKQWIKFGVEIECGELDDTQKAKDHATSIIDKWHKEAMPSKSIEIKQEQLPSFADLEQKTILLAELQAAKTAEEITTIYNEAPHSIKIDTDFFNEVLKAKKKLK